MKQFTLEEVNLIARQIGEIHTSYTNDKFTLSPFKGLEVKIECYESGGIRSLRVNGVWAGNARGAVEDYMKCIREFFEKKDTEDPTRQLVMDHMYWDGRHHDRVSTEEWETLYLMADGFGTIDRRFAKDQSWDWSHVRDSSPEAIQRMAEYIREHVYGGERVTG